MNSWEERLVSIRRERTQRAAENPRYDLSGIQIHNMCHFARLSGEDEEVWGVAGLLHDLDYEKFPEEHCKKAEEIMREHGIDDVYIRAMNCHAYGICTDIKPVSKMEQVLFTIDELTGLINALCLMRPLRAYWI